MGTNELSSGSSILSMKPNPSAINSESRDPIRRSSNGNPFAKQSSTSANRRCGFNEITYANNPSDLPRRSSFGKENLSSMCDYEDKENSKRSSLRPGRVQSPASTSKGTKNFMSPTISAASKFTTSPRKKILVDRNEPLRSSVSFSEAKSHIMQDKIGKLQKNVSFSEAISMVIEDDPLNSKMGLDKKKIEASHESIVNDALQSDSRIVLESPFHLKDDVGELSFNLKNDVDSSWKQKDYINLDPVFKISHRTSCSTRSHVFAPLDADPLMSPYDPKANYLSPRPQFLHYKPNPRIELLHRKGTDGKWLEESFISETSSDNEVSETSSEDSQKESEDVSSEETVKESSSEEELNVSEPIPSSTHKTKESAKGKKVSKSKFFTRSIFIVILLALVFVCLSIMVTDSPVTDLSMLKDVTLSNLYIPPEITEFAKANFEELSCKSRLWASNSFSYIVCKLIFELRGEDKLRPLKYGNLTALLGEDNLFGMPKSGQEYIMAPISERDAKVELLKESRTETEATEEYIEEVLESGEDNEIVEVQTEPESEEPCPMTPTEVIITASSKDQTKDTTVLFVERDIKQESNIDAVVGQPVEISELVEIQPQPVEISELVEIQPQPVISEVLETQPHQEEISEVFEIQPHQEGILEVLEIQPHSEKIGETTVHEGREPQVEDDAESTKAGDKLDTSSTVEKNHWNYVVVGGSIVLLTLLAAMSLSVWTKKAILSTSNATTPIQSVMANKLGPSPILVTPEPPLQETLASRNWQTEEADAVVLGASCPSEMSSFKRLPSHSKGLEAGASEAQSQERKARRGGSYIRESLASSDISLSSYSYGSFTTYEKLTSKHGQENDEVVTPVRRSNRIKKQVTSP